MPSPSSATSSARVLDSSRREIVNRVIERSSENRSLEYPGRCRLLFSRPPYFVILDCQIRLDVFLPQVGLREKVSFGERVILSPPLDLPCFFRSAQETSPQLSPTPRSAFSFRFSSWNMYNVYNRSSVSKVGNLPGCSMPTLAGLTFLSRCFFPFRLLPRLRDFI